MQLHPYSLQSTRSPPGPRLPKRIGNTHPRNYFNLKSKEIDVHFLFQVEELYCKLNYHDQKIRQTLAHGIQNYWTAASTLFGLISSVYRDFPHRRTNNKLETAVHWFRMSYASVCRIFYVSLFIYTRIIQ